MTNRKRKKLRAEGGDIPLASQFIAGGDVSVVIIDLKHDNASFQNAKEEAERAGLRFRVVEGLQNSPNPADRNLMLLGFLTDGNSAGAGNRGKPQGAAGRTKARRRKPRRAKSQSED